MSKCLQLQRRSDLNASLLHSSGSLQSQFPFNIIFFNGKFHYYVTSVFLWVWLLLHFIHLIPRP